MDNYKLTIGIEPTNKYEKAKQDLIMALKSYDDLTKEQKECLMKEFFGAANVAAICKVLRQFDRRR